MIACSAVQLHVPYVLGEAVSLSSDGSWVAAGAPSNNNGVGAIWIFYRNTSSASYEEYGPKVVGNGSIGSSQQGKIVNHYYIRFFCKLRMAFFQSLTSFLRELPAFFVQFFRSKRQLVIRWKQACGRGTVRQ